ncbi:MAG: conjugal transfer protein TraF [Sulfuricurvum sp.]|uniref:conjugal transfer protein TraF n=1 Tax=Sulfuricurvum sp. TaxID=2025608 RepID=UPI00260965A4|nr:conjugal transfer protein TraF [Sulfuricurvum sp.]MDD2828397.1 conjugal transfer protein TraF [Sulfuricurvum sp.]MDD4949402.1 conjugal transfer protein TraF [Sulfuricurvum sp.]
MTSSKILLSLVASACVATLSSAMEFQVLGAKAASMGGAGIATSPSSLAAYNNPALLANNPEKFTFHLGVGVGAKDTGAGAAAGKLSDMDFSSLNNKDATNLTTTDIDNLQKARDIIVGMNGQGFQVNPTADLGLSIGSFGTGLFVTSDIGAVANIDQTHKDLIWKQDNGNGTFTYVDIVNSVNVSQATYESTSLQYAVENKSTYLDVVGLAVYEIPLAYGYAFDTGLGSLSVGGVLKYMKGKTFYKQMNIDSDNTTNNLSDNAVDTSTFGIDLGMAFKPDALRELTLALVGKNLNTPSFDIAAAAGGGQYEIKPAIRAGLAYHPNSWVEFALDADLTNNKSLTHYDTRYVGGGLNFDLSLIELNVGLMKNTASNDQAGLIYTAGIATGPSWLHFELTGQMASKSGEVDGTSYPMQAMVNFAISSAW